PVDRQAGYVLGHHQACEIRRQLHVLEARDVDRDPVGVNAEADQLGPQPVGTYLVWLNNDDVQLALSGQLANQSAPTGAPGDAVTVPHTRAFQNAARLGGPFVGRRWRQWDRPVLLGAHSTRREAVEPAFAGSHDQPAALRH